MRIVFAGTPFFASFILEGLIKKGHQISLILTKHDNYSGRGLHLKESEVKIIANKYNIECLSPNSAELFSYNNIIYNRLLDINPDIIIVVAYGLILPKWLLELPKFGCVNIHASLLPRWRGAAPINRAIEYGDTKTGISIMQMDSGIDTGNIIMQESVDILPEYNSGDLYNILSKIGLLTINKVLIDLAKNRKIVSYKQSEFGITYAKKISKEELLIDTSMDAISINNKIRAFSPYPCTKILLPWLKEPVKIIDAEIINIQNKDLHKNNISLNMNGIDISTINGTLRITKIQRSGSKVQDIKQFINYLHNTKSYIENI